LTEIVHRRPREWFVAVDRLNQLLQSFGRELLRRAIGEAEAADLRCLFYRESIASRVEFSAGGAMKPTKEGGRTRSFVFAFPPLSGARACRGRERSRVCRFWARRSAPLTARPAATESTRGEKT
jgi:hypothetical protein